MVAPAEFLYRVDTVKVPGTRGLCMDTRPLAPTDAAVGAYVATLWVPYHRELAETVADHALARRPESELVAAECSFRREWLRDDDHELWVAVDRPATDGAVDPSAVDAPLAGFLAVEAAPAPPVFDEPDRLVVDDVYVRDPYRGTGLARDLFALAADRARAHDCERVALDVDVDNDRALAFYEKLGFAPVRHRLERDADAL